MFEKWSKLADAQAKLMATPSGMQCANVSVVTGAEIIGKSNGILEGALEEAEKARGRLLDENEYLRKLTLTAINQVQSVLHQARCLCSLNCEEVLVIFHARCSGV